jgi:hypothetical protein
MFCEDYFLFGVITHFAILPSAPAAQPLEVDGAKLMV